MKAPTTRPSTGRMTLWILIPLIGLVGCGDSSRLTDPAVEDAALKADAPAYAGGDNGAITGSGTFEGRFPPNPSVPYVPVPAPCLNLGEPLQMSGTWSGWSRTTLTPNGRLHVTEQIDWSEVSITLGDLTWLPGPGAYEPIVLNLPATPDDRGDAAFVVRHQFNIVFFSQDGMPDLRVTHSAKQVLGPDLEFRHNEFIPFAAECMGSG